MAVEPGPVGSWGPIEQSQPLTKAINWVPLISTREMVIKHLSAYATAPVIPSLHFTACVWILPLEGYSLDDLDFKYSTPYVIPMNLLPGPEILVFHHPNSLSHTGSRTEIL